MTTFGPSAPGEPGSGAGVRESEGLFRAFAFNQPDPIQMLDVDGTILICNEAAARAYGLTVAELIGMNAFAGIPAAVAAERRALFARAITTKRPVQYEEQVGERFYETRLVPILNSTGEADKVAVCPHDITTRKRAEEALHETTQTLGAIVRHSPLAIICTDSDTNVLIWNPAAERIFGWSEAEVLGLKNPIVPHDKDEEYARLRESVLRGNPYHSKELQRRRKDGASVCLNASSAALQDSRGTVIGLLGIFEDISERKRAEETLRASESRFRAAFENAGIGASLCDLTGRFFKVNRFLCELLGYSEEELLTKTFSDVTHPDDVWIGMDYLKRLIAGEMEFASFEKRYVRKDGAVVNLIISPALIRDNAGKPCHSVGLFQDITARKRAEDSLQRSEQFVRSILDTVDEGFIVIDRDFRILTANKAYCNQVGGTCDEIIGRHCYEISHRAPLPCYETGEECAVREVFATGEPHTANHRHTDAQGTVLFVETKAYPIRDRSGAVTSVIETISNITEKHLLEEERLKTQKLEAIGTLAGGIAHDFNNLLQGVFGYISLAKMKLDPREPSCDILAQAEQALQLSVNLTTQLLTFSKGGKPAKKRFALRPLIENSVKFALSGSRVDYRIALKDDLLTVKADEGQIGQVIQNIVLNAAQALPLGGTVVIETKNVRAPGKGLPLLLSEGKYVALSIQDSGVGIPERFLQKIFDPYFTTKEKGSGLGLATSYSIVNNHGGFIDVTSEFGRGTTFTVYLPASELEKAAPQAVAAVSAPVVRRGNVLVMDDEQVVRDIAGEMIKALGHAVDKAKNGEEAIEKYRIARESGSPFDILILDLTIRGGLGGKETLERLRRIDPGVKAIVSSGYSDDAVLADHLAYGFCSHLAKPYRLEVLRETLDALLA